MNNFITLTEFVKQVKEVEGVTVAVVNYNTHSFAEGKIKVPPYPYTIPMNGKCTQEEFIQGRIYPCLKEFFTDDYFIFCMRGE